MVFGGPPCLAGLNPNLMPSVLPSFPSLPHFSAYSQRFLGSPPEFAFKTLSQGLFQEEPSCCRLNCVSQKDVWKL